MIRSPAWPRHFSQSYPRPSPRPPGHDHDAFDDDFGYDDDVDDSEAD